MRVIQLPDAPARERRSVADWGLRVAGALLVAAGLALVWMARSALYEAAHPVDTAPATLRSSAATISVVAVVFLAIGMRAVLGGRRARMPWIAVAVAASTVALLPWTTVVSRWGAAVNVVGATVAVASWARAARPARRQTVSPTHLIAGSAAQRETQGSGRGTD